jgi:hypothetical protein
MKIASIGIAVLGLLAVVAPVDAAESCLMSYETFEHAVPHVDLEECPGTAATEEAFCRLSVGGEQVHLFYFAFDGDQCLLKVRSFDEADYSITLGQ